MYGSQTWCTDRNCLVYHPDPAAAPLNPEPPQGGSGVVGLAPPDPYQERIEAIAAKVLAVLVDVFPSNTDEAEARIHLAHHQIGEMIEILLQDLIMAAAAGGGGNVVTLRFEQPQLLSLLEALDGKART
jgi:hypothetical protein